MKVTYNTRFLYYLLIVMKRVIDRLIPVTCISRQLKLSSYRVIFMIKYWRMFNS